MNSANKKPPATTGTPQPFNRPLGHAPQIRPLVAQRKIAVPGKSVKRPVAPPVYCPQPVPKVLQKKAAPVQHTHARQPLRPPGAPPVHRLAAKPVIAQAKMAGNSQIRKLPIAPPVYRPQAKPGAARTNPVVQRFADGKFRGLGSGKMSQSEHYFIPEPDKNTSIFVRTGALAPRSSDPQINFKFYQSRRYQEYKPRNLFINDCLHTAEEINANQKLDQGKDRSQVAGLATPFGSDHKQNIEAAKKNPPDDKAIPGLGQAYVIVNKKWLTGAKDGDYPYHAAGVVATDGGDRVTLEVCATDEDAVMRDTDGKYDMYETGAASGKTFHSYWKDKLFKDESATMVIEPVPQKP